MAEQRSPKPQVGGSIPSWPATLWQQRIKGKGGMALNKKNGSNDSSSSKALSHTSGRSSLLNYVCWLVLVLLIVAGVTANVHFQSVDWAVRAALGILVFCVALALFLLTDQGKRALGFYKTARVELRKVIWPGRQEVVQSTIMVVVVVIVTAIVLWGVDTLFLNGIGWLVGQRG